MGLTMKGNWWTWERRQELRRKLRLLRREWGVLVGILGWVLVFPIGLVCVCAGLVEGRAGPAIPGALAIVVGWVAMAWAI